MFCTKIFLLSIVHPYTDIINSMLRTQGLPAPIVRAFCNTILDQYIEAQHNDMSTKESHTLHFGGILHTLQQRFPTDLDAALESKVKVRFVFNGGVLNLS